MSPHKYRLRVEPLERREVAAVGAGVATAFVAMPEQAPAPAILSVRWPPGPIVPAFPPGPIIPGLGLETAASAMDRGIVP